jgi:hypothetical protein
VSVDPLSQYGIKAVPANLAVRLDEPLLWLRRVASLCVDELHPVYRVPWSQRVRAWRRGFTTKSFVMYQLENNDPRAYVSEFVQKVKTHDFNGSQNTIINDKLGFSLLMSACDAPHPPVLAVIRRGRIHPLEPAGPVDAAAWLSDRLEEADGVVIKPLRGFKGLGFAAIRRDDSGVTLNGDPSSLEDLEQVVARLDDYYVTPFVRQAAYARELYPSTTNTVRLLSYWDVERDEPFIAAAVHRIGTKRSFPVDNWKSGRGGLSARIDLDSGELGPAVSVTSEGRLQWHEAHPESKARIAGARLPHWEQLKGDVLRLAARLSFTPDLCWDGVMTDSGHVFLELNGASALFVFQVHAPLLSDPRVRAFYRRYGVIRQ